MREKETSKCCLTRGPEMQERQSPRWPQPACSLRSPAHSPLALTSQLSDCESGHYLSLAKQPGVSSGAQACRSMSGRSRSRMRRRTELRRAQTQASQATGEAARKRGAQRRRREDGGFQSSPTRFLQLPVLAKEDARKLLPAQGRFLEFHSASVDFRGS